MGPFALALLLLAPRTVDDLRAVLKRFEKDPRAQAEREQAIRELGAIGTPESTRVLEALLDDPFAHIRDEAATALGRTRAVPLLGELLVRRDSPETRAHIARALGLARDREAVPFLAAALRAEKDPRALDAIADALGALGGYDALRQRAKEPACLRALGDADIALAHRECPDDALHAAVVDVLFAARRPVLPDYEADGTTGELLGIALARALPRTESALARRRAAALLAHRSWRVRAAALQAVEVLRDPTLLGDLVERLGEERGRLRHETWGALRRLTGKDLPPEPAKWRAALPVATLAQETARTTDGLASERIAFVLDLSEGATPIEHVRETLTRLGPAQRYDLFVYRYPLAYPPRPHLERAFGKLRAGATAEALAWLESREAEGGWALFDALLAALNDPEVDTVYLVSSGLPGFGTVKQHGRVVEEVRRVNRWRRVAVHGVALDGDEEHGRLLWRLR